MSRPPFSNGKSASKSASGHSSGVFTFGGGLSIKNVKISKNPVYQDCTPRIPMYRGHPFRGTPPSPPPFLFFSRIKVTPLYIPLLPLPHILIISRNYGE